MSNEYTENILDVITKFVKSSHFVPDWTLNLVDTLIRMVDKDGTLSEEMFRLINILLIYMDKSNVKEIHKCCYILMLNYNSEAEPDDVLESTLLCHLLIFYHHDLLTQEMKEEILNRTVKIILTPDINIHDRLFSKLILLVLIFLKVDFEATSLALENNNDFLRTFYNLAYNDSSTYIEDYDYKVFVISNPPLIQSRPTSSTSIAAPPHSRTSYNH